MGLLKRLRSVIQQSQQSEQIEILRMTHQGGWAKHDPFPEDDDPFPEDEAGKMKQWDRLESADDWPIFGIPGKYRVIRRVDGRIRETIWRYETSNADRHYERERQRELLKEMSYEEVKQEYFDGPDRLNLLELSEICDRYEKLRDARRDASSDDHGQDQQTGLSRAEINVVLPGEDDAVLPGEDGDFLADVDYQTDE